MGGMGWGDEEGKHKSGGQREWEKECVDIG